LVIKVAKARGMPELESAGLGGMGADAAMTHDTCGSEAAASTMGEWGGSDGESEGGTEGAGMAAEGGGAGDIADEAGEIAGAGGAGRVAGGGFIAEGGVRGGQYRAVAEKMARPKMAPWTPPLLTCFGAIAALVRDDEAAGIEEVAGSTGGEIDDEGEPSDDIEEGHRAVSGEGDGRVAHDACGDILAHALATGIDMSDGKSKPKRSLGGGTRFGTLGGGISCGGAEAATATAAAVATPARASTTSSALSTKAAGARWDWRADLHEILKKRGGLEKLNRPKPSTGEFGNWGVIEACRRVSAAAAAAAASDPRAPPTPVVTCKVVVGTKTKARKHLEVVLSSKGDQDAAAEKEWAGLRSLFARDDIVLIFHLKNHYALVYALREQTHRAPIQTDAGTVDIEEENQDGEHTAVRLVRRRELLTARKGQRPTEWIPWEEARETMLRWTGYGVLAVQLER